jgi:hypothetical protein
MISIVSAAPGYIAVVANTDPGAPFLSRTSHDRHVNFRVRQRLVEIGCHLQ